MLLIPMDKKLLLRLAIPLISLVLIIYAHIHFPSSTVNTFYIILALALILALTSTFLIVTYGISIGYFIFFGVVAVFGPVVGLFVLSVATSINLILATRSTPIDFMICKNARIVVMQAIYFLIGVVFITIISKLAGAAFLENLTFYYMLSFLLYIGVSYPIYIILERAPIGRLIPRAIIQTTLNYWLVVTFGLSYIQYLQNLVG